MHQFLNCQIHRSYSNFSVYTTFIRLVSFCTAFGIIGAIITHEKRRNFSAAQSIIQSIVCLMVKERWRFPFHQIEERLAPHSCGRSVTALAHSRVCRYHDNIVLPFFRAFFAWVAGAAEAMPVISKAMTSRRDRMVFFMKGSPPFLISRQPRTGLRFNELIIRKEKRK